MGQGDVLPGMPGVGASDEDALFDHLERLVADLPGMQEKGDRLERARAARDVLDAERNLRTCQAMLDHMDAALAEERAALKAATEAGDGEAIVKHERGVVYFSAQRGYRVGPVQNAQAAVEKALANSPFTALEEARGAALSKETCASLSCELEAYRADYAATLAACERMEQSEQAE